MSGDGGCDVPEADGEVPSSCAITCNREGNLGNPCEYRQKGWCDFIPLRYGAYCAYEKEFVNRRYGDLVTVFSEFDKGQRASGIDGYRINHTILWAICHIYANDLKPIRQFHNNSRGVGPNRRAAFLARLISNHRPIYISEFTSDYEVGPDLDAVLKINESFAIAVFFHFLVILEDDIKRCDALLDVVRELMFIFTHRDPQTESFVCIARMATAMVRQNRRYLRELLDLQEEVRALRARAKKSESIFDEE